MRYWGLKMSWRKWYLTCGYAFGFWLCFTRGEDWELQMNGFTVLSELWNYKLSKMIAKLQWILNIWIHGKALQKYIPKIILFLAQFYKWKFKQFCNDIWQKIEGGLQFKSPEQQLSKVELIVWGWWEVYWCNKINGICEKHLLNFLDFYLCNEKAWIF